MVTYPNDWDVRSIGEFVHVGRGASPRPIEAFLTTSVDGVNWIKIGDAPRYGKYITQTAEKVTQDGAARSVRVNAGDFILSNSMSFGRPYILTIDGCIHDGWLRLYDYKDSVDKEFLYYVLSSEETKKQYATFAAGSGVQNLNKTVVKKVVVHLPAIPEQKRIAKVLSEMDEHIDNLAELIEKKKGIRDGALEDLLSGRTRLSGFQDDWVEVPLVDALREKVKIGPFGSQLKKETLLTQGEYKVYGQENIYARNFQIGDRYLIKEHFDRLSSCEIVPGDFLMSTMGTIGKCAIAPQGIKKGIMDSHLIRFRINEDILLPEYLLQLFSENYTFLSKQTERLAVGGIMDGLSVGIVNQLMLLMPSNINEQKAIANTLIAMDNEINVLEDERNKMIQIREGAMDDLLSGRVRLPM